MPKPPNYKGGRFARIRAEKNEKPYREPPELPRRRIAKRRARLNEIAQAAGWPSWEAYATAVLNGKVRIAEKKV